MSRLKLNGRNRRNQASPTINARKAVFARNQVTNNHSGICFLLGVRGYGRAREAVIRGNRIHDCGKLPATNHGHGIYVARARNTLIKGNWIYGHADRGIQLYPDADGTTIRGNVIDANGEGIIFGSGDRNSPDRNLVEGNVISYSRIRYNVESNSQGARYGSGNMVRRNCLWARRGRYSGKPRRSGIQSGRRGFAARRNVVAKPRYVSRRTGNYFLRADSRCRSILR